MSDEMISELTNFIGILSESGIVIDGAKFVNRDTVIEIMRGVIQNEWMRTGVLAVVE